jgi:hypothetical protein
VTARCFVCDARLWEPTDRSLLFRSGRRRHFGFACGACGILSDGPERGAEASAHLAEKLSGDVFHSDEGAPYGLDVYTLRTAATRAGLGIEPTDAEQAAALRRPHGELAAAARLLPLPRFDGAAVSLGLPCRPEDMERVLATVPAHAAWTDDVVVLVDTQTVPSRAAAGARVVARPLAGDFAAQRNALQRLGRHPWMLQLDADESLEPETVAYLPRLAALADRDGALSIGLSRRNLVDGVQADLFPDVQYRLNRREVTYAGRVHERPDRPWQRSFIALTGAIRHHLGRARVLSRSRRYEAMAPGHGRLKEAEALLRPYRD